VEYESKIRAVLKVLEWLETKNCQNSNLTREVSIIAKTLRWVLEVDNHIFSKRTTPAKLETPKGGC